ncbi:hypothetical protein PBRA_002376 [Plasmodiophora brassicae]|uniref:RGS domain-containing protein n=1 Tax=Plasmodiophora brassicae TaxID=37360 RepID=A0A0G4J4E6_PLABS|nr:hypothetical protein PBRA_002376 [Plasmodiophora brassicae]
MATSARVAGQFDHYILRHSWMYSSRTIWVGIALTTVVLTTIRMSMLMPINCYEPSNIRDPIYLAVWISTIAYLAYSLRATRDAFKVMAEFKALLVMLTIGFLLVAPDLAFTSFSAAVNPHKYFQFVILFAGMSWNAISTLYPTYLTYKYHQMQDTESATALDDKLTSVTTTMSTATQPRLAVEAPLKAVLTHPIGYERFKEFLRTEFSVENLLCWSAVTAVIKDCQKRVVTMDEFDQKFKDIYDLYIAPGSPNEVRLAGFLDSSRRTPQKISVVPGEDIDIFEDDGVDSSKVAALRELQREIFKLMENDSFNRFKHSKKFARFIAMEQ